jgi:hypothetical protein
MTFYTAPTYTEVELENLELEEMHFPYNDTELYYNGHTHQYEILEQAFKNRGINIRADLKAKGIDDLDGFLKRVSQKFYLYAYKHCYMNSPIAIKYLIAVKGIVTMGNLYEYRQQIIEIMVMLGEYLCNNGDVSQVSGFDLDSGATTDIRSLRYEERDYPAEMKAVMHPLGLDFAGKYRFYVDGIGKEW